jgi:hypothetical protein
MQTDPAHRGAAGHLLNSVEGRDPSMRTYAARMCQQNRDVRAGKVLVKVPRPVTGAGKVSSEPLGEVPVYVLVRACKAKSMMLHIIISSNCGDVNRFEVVRRCNEL